MAKSRKNVFQLIQHVSSNRQGGLSLESLVHPAKASRGSSAGSMAASSEGMHILPLSANDHSRAIQFGAPSSSGAQNSGTSSSSSSGLLQNVLGQSASGGVGGLLQNGLGNLGGIGSIVSSLFHLFGSGGKSTPPPLVRFQLPSAQEQTAYVSSSGSSVYGGNVVENGTSQSGSGSKNATAQTGGGQGQSQQYQSGEIAQAVKTALLTSSTLNDVISEI